jgi:peptide/nickel transport system permease protein
MSAINVPRSASAWRDVRPLVGRAGLTLLTAVLVAFIGSSVCYLLLYLTPINAAAAILGGSGSAAQVHRLAVSLGTTQSFAQQYWHWLSHALRGDLGQSYFTRLPVSSSIAQRFPVDFSIALLAIVLAAAVGLAAGIAAARRPGGIVDRAVTTCCGLAVSIPEFWSGILLILIFAVAFRALPGSGYVAFTASPVGWFEHSILPAVSLALVPAAAIARQLRTSLVSVLSENYIVGARVRGLGPRRVLFGHAVRNAAGPAVAALGFQIPHLMGGAVVAETVFGLPGLGQLALQGAQDKDMPVIQGVLVVLIGLVLVANLLVNALLGWLHPESKG